MKPNNHPTSATTQPQQPPNLSNNPTQPNRTTTQPNLRPAIHPGPGFEVKPAPCGCIPLQRMPFRCRIRCPQCLSMARPGGLCDF